MSARSIYVASPEGHTGKSSIALGIVDLLVGQVRRVGVFRPVIRSRSEPDAVLSLLLRHVGVDLPYEDCTGVTYDEIHADPEAALGRIISRYRDVAHRCDVVVIVGSDYTDVAGPTELAYNTRIAANLGSAVVLVTSAWQRAGSDVRHVVDVAMAELAAGHAQVVAVVASRAVPEHLEDVRAALADLPVPSWALPDVPLLSAPSARELMDAVDGALWAGDDALLDREVENVIVGGMTMDHILDRLTDGAMVIVPGDRSEVVLSIVAAHAAESFPSLAALMLNGGYLPSEQVTRLVQGLGQRLPIVTTGHGTFETASRAAATPGLMGTGSQRKIDVARSTFEAHVDGARLRAAVAVPRASVVTPLMFEYDLIERARASRKHVVLPEGGDERILRAASTLLARDVVDLTLLGDEQAIRARATELGLDLSGAQVLSPTEPELRERFAQEYARLRAHRGMTVDRAREVVTDVSYFGTMMVQLGLADGMVSGAAHTTAHTIKPAFEIIKTSPGTQVVSSVFFMCLPDQVLVYGDCAVNPDPNAAQLADIALSSAETAAQFGVDPRVAMLSYSTGTSGFGADVDKVREATDLARERAGALSIEGPIQYDAAVDASVAATKLPGSDVAGKATVFIFPDLNTGNNTYKAVQRSAGAVAVGPVLQGLRKPVNDLSRGALVQDIVNTVAITAIQAQGLDTAAGTIGEGGPR
ncbi:phosphate acetyltransferase [Pseudactinotalea sp. HY158]|uniref:phosphate acetyltransferase n=1 Tax=Pseudactinotalea sp. HY158 TaxID=2654547 RepID=UPI00129CBED9|nr:phosphate acetyltransferase [Pseudactinotalea sp. HY158]QGH70360.1 phosphate acetyltransferase [Pseudactinotalea sp. HY158]